MTIRAVKRSGKAQPAIEGAGVKLNRVFGFGDTADFDPFLMMDDFRNDRPADYLAGFPWHPHRGIETITYVLAGTVEHGDSLGNRGTLGAGDVQWMTAGRGIMHQEMPKGDAKGRMHGFQLWANLPRDLKMTAPRYQDVPAAEIAVLGDDDGTIVRVVCGDYKGKRGPVDGTAVEPRYLDISIPAGRRKSFPTETYRQAFAYVFEGCGDVRRRIAAIRRADRARGAGWRRDAGARDVRQPLAGGVRCRRRGHRRGRARTASASCSSPAARSQSRSPGTARS